MIELRDEDPALYINFTTGSWPSPFWLRYADSLCGRAATWALPVPAANSNNG
jgi:hypothetical protein